MISLTQQAALASMIAQRVHAIQATLSEQLTQPSMTTLMQFRSAHMADGKNMGYTQTFVDADHKIVATLTYNNHLKMKRITVKALDKVGMRESTIFTIDLKGLDTRPVFGEDWMVLRSDYGVQAVLDLYRSVCVSLPVVIDAL
jgi:hypothetical protein